MSMVPAVACDEAAGAVGKSCLTTTAPLPTRVCVRGRAIRTAA